METEAKTYKPSEVVLECYIRYGQVLTLSVLHKYHYKVLRLVSVDGQTRHLYTEADIITFAKISILRSIGIPLDEIKNIVNDKVQSNNPIAERLHKHVQGINTLYPFII